MLALIPIFVLILLISLSVGIFGNDTLSGASQVALLVASAVCVIIGLKTKRLTWPNLETILKKNVGSSTIAIIILMLIGALSSTWMLSGVVPTMIYYGMKIIKPEWFLISACVLCALVSLMTGSSWTTVATMGIALMGIGKAYGFADGWIAGAIISGAYFGDKLSPLSDTTVLASSITDTPLFTHIRYMMQTTIPTFIITLIIFIVAGFCITSYNEDTAMFTDALKGTFRISPWLLLVPVATGVMIVRKWHTLAVLFIASLIGAVVAMFAQTDIIPQVVQGEHKYLITHYLEGIVRMVYDRTTVTTGVETLDNLVGTRGMIGMLPTIWLIICAQTFGAAFTASGLLQDITNYLLKLIKGRTSLVATTVGTSMLLNMLTPDQYLSIILTGQTYKDIYKKKGYESRLLSRSTEDGGTVTSVLVPWNTCGLTQSTVLGVATLTYLPYCFFNILSPITSIAVAAIGKGIVRKKPEEIEAESAS